jgi:hypothetical protein
VAEVAAQRRLHRGAGEPLAGPAESIVAAPVRAMAAAAAVRVRRVVLRAVCGFADLICRSWLGRTEVSLGAALGFGPSLCRLPRTGAVCLRL